MATRIKPTDFDLTHIDILGRGPSVDSYIPRKNAFVICCHYPIVECNAIGTRHFGEYGFYTVPYITIRDVETIDGNMDIFDAANKFLSSKRRRFPIVQNGKLVGQISQKDILKAALELKSENWNSTTKG